jgi:hypothetical protein
VANQFIIAHIFILLKKNNDYGFSLAIWARPKLASFENQLVWRQLVLKVDM